MAPEIRRIFANFSVVGDFSPSQLWGMKKAKFNQPKLQALKAAQDAGWRRIRDISSSADFYRERAAQTEAEIQRHPLGKIRPEDRVRVRDDLRQSFAALEAKAAADRREWRRLADLLEALAAEQAERGQLLQRCLDLLKARGIDPGLIDETSAQAGQNRRADIIVSGGK